MLDKGRLDPNELLELAVAARYTAECIEQLVVDNRLHGAAWRREMNRARLYRSHSKQLAAQARRGAIFTLQINPLTPVDWDEGCNANHQSPVRPITWPEFFKTGGDMLGFNT